MVNEGFGEGELLGGRYRIICLLGKGGMALVYLARDEHSAGEDRAEGTRLVAIKAPTKKALDDPTAAERFERETRRQFSHPHIVPILDAGIHDGIPFVVMLYLPGGTFRDRRQRDGQGRPLPGPPEILHNWLPAVAAALDHVHANGSVHRDVKPSNILFDPYWHAFVGDFGVAKKIGDGYDPEDPLTTTNMGVGTWDYMAPEQCASKPVIDGRADQYALAVIVYEMLAGRRPFIGDSGNAVIVEKLMKPVPSLADLRSELPRTLVEAVHRALSKAPGDRFATCRQFAAAALRDVPHVLDESGLVRLICLACRSVIPLPQERRGQMGRCPQCKARVRVAHDLSGLWPQDNGWPRATASEGTGSGPVWTPVDTGDSGSQPRGRRAGRRRRRGPVTRQTFTRVLVGGLAALAVILAGVVFGDWLVHTEWYAYQQALKHKDYAVIGRYHCLVERRWDDEGLKAYVKSRLFGFKDCATTELEVKDGEGRAGRLFRAARRWWELSNNPDIKIEDPRYGTKRSLNDREKTSLRLHARELYESARVGYNKTMSKEERQEGQGLYDSDPSFQKFVGNARP